MDATGELLRCVSVHSVKGGVGKSTLSYAIARALARHGPTLLVDMDLTGTSLADVLPLRAPCWSGGLNLREAPDASIPWREAQDRIRERGASSGRQCEGVPFLNDFLLWQGDRADPSRDVHPDALMWRLDERQPLASTLRVIPSSALPRDLAAILPIIYDEPHAAWLESRLEWLLDFLLERTAIRSVIFDSPPTIPGLSRTLLSMAMRLPVNQDLADEGGTPPRLKAVMVGHQVQWTPLLIVSPDHQDLRAAERWLVGCEPAELDAIRVVLNMVEDRPRDQLAWRLRGALATGEESDPAEIGMAELAEEDYVGALLARERERSHLAVVRRTPGASLFRPAMGSALQILPDISEILDLLRT